MTKVSFEIRVTAKDAIKFAEISGDWNPLHTDPGYAATTPFKNTVLHGAYSAGLISQLAGMHLPGARCLLHGMRFRFLAPIIPPANLIVSGQQISGSDEGGKVDALVIDKESGRRYVEAFYEYGLHETNDGAASVQKKEDASSVVSTESPILVTGASGGVGAALLDALGEKCVGVSRTDAERCIIVDDYEHLDEALEYRSLSGLVHCAWPAPDNSPFTKLDYPAQSIECHVAAPLRQIQALSRLFVNRAKPNAPFVLLGSTYSSPGRHYFRTPLYSMAKSMVPTVVQALSFEFAAASSARSIGVVFDVLDGGMNNTMTKASKLSQADRTPLGQLGTVEDAAQQILWLLENGNHMINGAVISITSGALP